MATTSASGVLNLCVARIESCEVRIRAWALTHHLGLCYHPALVSSSVDLVKRFNLEFLGGLTESHPVPAEEIVTAEDEISLVGNHGLIERQATNFGLDRELISGFPIREYLPTGRFGFLLVGFVKLNANLPGEIMRNDGIIRTGIH